MTESETKNQKRKRLKETAARCVPILQGDGKCTHWYEELYEEIHVAPQLNHHQSIIFLLNQDIV